MQCAVIGAWLKSIRMNGNCYQDDNLQYRDTENILSAFGRRENSCLSHSESTDSLFIIPTSVTPHLVVITLPLMGKKIMYNPGERCTHTNLLATFREQSTQSSPNSRSNRASSAGELHPIYNKAERKGGTYPSLTDP